MIMVDGGHRGTLGSSEDFAAGDHCAVRHHQPAAHRDDFGVQLEMADRLPRPAIADGQGRGIEYSNKRGRHFGCQMRFRSTGNPVPHLLCEFKLPRAFGGDVHESVDVARALDVAGTERREAGSTGHSTVGANQ